MTGNASVGKPNVQEMQKGAYPEEKKKSVAGQFAAVKYRTGTITGKTSTVFFFSRLRFV